MSPPKNPVLAGASWWMLGAETESGVGHGGDSTAKAAKANCQGHRNEARANNSRGAPRALRVAWRCAGALEEPAGRA